MYFQVLLEDSLVELWYQTLHNSSRTPQRRFQRPLSTLQSRLSLSPHSNMYATVHYFVSLALILTNCVSPVNWKHCAPVNEWLPPYITDYTVYMEEWGGEI
jgi:hypothetical protein